MFTALEKIKAPEHDEKGRYEIQQYNQKYCEKLDNDCWYVEWTEVCKKHRNICNLYHSSSSCQESFTRKGSLYTDCLEKSKKCLNNWNKQCFQYYKYCDLKMNAISFYSHREVKECRDFVKENPVCIFDRSSNICQQKFQSCREYGFDEDYLNFQICQERQKWCQHQWHSECEDEQALCFKLGIRYKRKILIPASSSEQFKIATKKISNFLKILKNPLTQLAKRVDLTRNNQEFYSDYPIDL
jgi:hypothetical protein